MAGRTDWVEEVQPRGFRPYREYRDSGVEWLGNIPAHWEVERLKFLATLNDEALPEATDPNLEMNYVDISSVDAISGITGTDTIIFEKAPSRARRVVRRGDVIVSTVRTYLRAIAAIEASESNLIVSTGFAVLRARRLDSSFASYALRAPHFVERVVANSVGVSYPAINASSLACFPIPYPGVDEQRVIADFLDCETAKIDGLVARKERLIELLQEKRTALITRAVTRGLDPNVPMKDSGVEWLGQLPADWEVRRIAMAVNKITNGYVGPTRDILVEDGVPYLQSLHIKNGQIEFDRKHYFVTKHWSEQHRKSVLREGDVLVVQTGDIGQNCVVPAAFEGTNCHALIILRLKPELGEGAYFSLLLQSTYGQIALKRSQTGALHPHLECGHVREIPLVIPPPEEQRRIMRAVEEQLEALNSLQAKVREAVDRLKEFRTALISAAVTGKIDVREAMPR